MKTISTLLASLLMASVFSQPVAKNFNANDCNAANHDLFTELDAGNVVVLCWVMPCAACVGPAKSAHDISKTYATSNPGKVRFYLCDDYGNTSCATLNNWAASNGITDYTAFSSNKIKMTDFGAPGMPKTVIISGGNCHLVYFDQNNGLNTLAFTTAMNAALSATAGPTHSVSAVSQTTTLPMSTVTSQDFFQTNTGNAKIRLKIEPVSDSLPASWMFSLCVNGACTAGIPTGTMSTDSLAAGGTATISLGVDPGSETGSGKVKVFVYQDGFRPCGDTLTWEFNTGTVGLPTVNPQGTPFCYPNPVKDKLHLVLPQGIPAICVIFDVTGRPVLTAFPAGTKNEIDLAALAPGVYFVGIRCGEEIYYSRCIRE